jgi:hypothetical protein
LENRRSGPRSEICFPILLKTSFEDVERPVRLSDMSSRGVALYSDQPLEPSSQIEVIMLVPYEISLTKMIAVKVPAEVLRVEESQGSGHHRIAAALRPNSDSAQNSTTSSSRQAFLTTMGHA